MASKSDKTEQATPQRRRKAREEGQIARSAEVSVFVGLGMGMLTMRVFLPTGVTTLANEVRALFTNLDPAMIPTAATGRPIMFAAAGLMAPFLGSALIGGLGAGFAMTKFNISLKAAKPKWSAIDPRKGVKKFAPMAAGWELTRTLIKLVLLGLVAWGPMTRMAGLLGGAKGIDASVDILAGEAWVILTRALTVAFCLGAADYLYNFRKTERDMKMEKHEVKQENKNSEGDPAVKGERRRRQAEMSRNRMMADVSRADVVLVNPTDYAIALKYENGDAAPKVLAKGADHLAAKIRAEATRTGVPIHVDIPLCRALYRQVKVGDYIPRPLFDAIAVVLVWAYRRTGRGPSTSTANAGTPVRRQPAITGAR